MSDTAAVLAASARAINDAHRACESAARSPLAHAVTAGRLLLDAKERLGPGEWLPWLAANVQCSVRTAQGYMRVARAPEMANSETSAHFSLDGALKLLTAPSEDFPAGFPDPPLRIVEVARILNIRPQTVYDIVGLDWVEYQGRGRRPIRRITAESVRRVAAGRRHREDAIPSQR